MDTFKQRIHIYRDYEDPRRVDVPMFSLVIPASLSETGLSISDAQAVIQQVNDLSDSIFNSVKITNILLVILSLLSCWILEPLVMRRTRSLADQMDQFIDTVNEREEFKSRRVEIISPRKTAWLSLDFEIPISNPVMVYDSTLEL
ncbi:Golgin subfamily A member 7/ERF4 [Lipomyces oligophaga]|uniref:Golgin subfamily A member 7/ERF4 n=1 Tax=Lipomyces oligophaga TaxID=45792 RepID=UPI0034CE83BB